MKNWQELLVNPEMQLQDVVKILDKGAQGIVMVVDANFHLIGTITDGDIRRALINHLAMDSTLDRVMCKTPKVAKVSWSREIMLATMEKYNLLQLPIVDSDNRVVGLEILKDVLHKHRYDNPVFLSAGGMGTRLYPLTKDCPKPLLRVGNKPILELILERFISAGFHRFYISTHYLPEMIRDYFGDGNQWGVSISYVHEEQPLGTGGAIGLLPHHEIDLPLFVMNGDLLTSLGFKSLLEFHYDHQGLATICVRKYEYHIPFGVIDSHGHRVLSIIEKPTHKFFISAGIYVFEPELVRKVRPGVRIDIPDLIQMQIDQGEAVNMFPIHEYWLDIGQPEDFNRAQIDINLIRSSISSAEQVYD